MEITTEPKEKFYNKEKEYDEVIMPLLELIRKLCTKHDIPFVFGTVIKRDDDGIMIATAGRKTTDGWVPAELMLARAMMLGEMQLVGSTKKDVLDALVDELVQKHSVTKEDKDGN